MSALLPVRTVAKPWGVDVLPPPFVAPAGERIGEIWFEPPPQLPQLLVKHIFTSEALSVQVHPSDAQTLAAGLGKQGKEECWLITSAEPGAKLGIGFTQPLDADTIRAAALDGSIEHLLEWHPVEPGDVFHIPANTVHAIGAGVGLIEVQQNSDVTYRLYDYGRPRALHLEQGIAAARGEPYAPALHRRLPGHGEATLVEGPHFRLDRLDGAPSAEATARYRGALLAIPLSGALSIGGEPIRPGLCALAPALDQLANTGLCLITQPCS